MIMCVCRIAVCLLLLCSGESEQCTDFGTKFHRAPRFNTCNNYFVTPVHFRVAMTLSWFVFRHPLPYLCSVSTVPFTFCHIW